MKKFLMLCSLCIVAVSCYKQGKTSQVKEEDLVVDVDTEIVIPEVLTSALYSLDINGLKDKKGKVIISNIGDGVTISLDAKKLVPGAHGFHLHKTNNLMPSTNKDGILSIGGMAQGHWDPDNTGKHAGPNGNGHRGDLPFVVVAENGNLKTIITNKRLRIGDFKGKSLMIHIKGDNYSDIPEPLGGGGARMYAAPF